MTIPEHCSPSEGPDVWKEDGLCPDCAQALIARIADLELSLRRLLGGLTAIRNAKSPLHLSIVQDAKNLLRQ